MKTPVSMAVRSHAGVPASAASKLLFGFVGLDLPSPTGNCCPLDQVCKAGICSTSARAVFSIYTQSSNAVRTAIRQTEHGTVDPRNRIMKSQLIQIFRTFWMGLLMASAFGSICGCTSMDVTNTAARPWGGPLEKEQCEDQWRAMGPTWFFPSPTVEQQRNEEWLRSH
jgi:hypothetical protein